MSRRRATRCGSWMGINGKGQGWMGAENLVQILVTRDFILRQKNECNKKRLSAGLSPDPPDYAISFRLGAISLASFGVGDATPKFGEGVGLGVKTQNPATLHKDRQTDRRNT